MIKCFGFGKLLKQLFIISLISCFGLLGSSFVNAGTVQSVGLDKYNSEYNSSFKVGFIKGGGVLTEYLGTAKSVLALDSNVLFWWAENGQPYFYAPGFQGFFNEFYTCSVLTGTNSPFASNCQSTTFTDDYKIILKSFFSKVKQGDYAGYDYFYNRTSGGNGYNHQARIQVCFSSEEIGSSLCFRYSTCSVSTNLSYCNGRNYGSLVNSQNLSDLTFANIPRSYISYAPGQVGYDGDYSNDLNGDSNITIDTIITGDYVYSTCTNGEIINKLESEGFSKYMCYGGLDNFSLYDSSLSYSPIPGTGKRLSEILAYSNARDTPSEWFNFWAGLYKDRYNSTYNAMWESYPAVYRTWFDLYYQYGGNYDSNYFDMVREYCVMIVDLSLDMNNKYSGNIFKNVCSVVIEDRNNPGFNSSGDVVVGVNWDGVGGMSGVKVKDGITFIQDYFNNLKSVLNTSYSGGAGFLPTYIILFMLAIILFRFLSH